MSEICSPSPSRLFFCPHCRQPFSQVETCPTCHVLTNAQAVTYVEKLLEAVLFAEPYRAGIAVDVLTRQLHEPRATVPLILLLERRNDPLAPVLAARGLGWLRAKSAVPALVALLLSESRPFVARVAAAEALGQIGGQQAQQALRQAAQSPRSSVAAAALRALDQLQKAEQEISS